MTGRSTYSTGRSGSGHQGPIRWTMLATGHGYYFLSIFGSFLTQIFVLSTLSRVILDPSGNAEPRSVHGPFTDGEL